MLLSTFLLTWREINLGLCQVVEDSPMVVVESEVVVKEQWRVPPIKDNQTVDIFTEPEYFQVTTILAFIRLS